VSTQRSRIRGQSAHGLEVETVENLVEGDKLMSEVSSLS